MHMGFTMRQECIAAVQAKVLRLNSAAISSVTTGKVRCMQECHEQYLFEHATCTLAMVLA